jgi:hypothetical protein
LPSRLVVVVVVPWVFTAHSYQNIKTHFLGKTRQVANHRLLGSRDPKDTAVHLITTLSRPLRITFVTQASWQRATEDARIAAKSQKRCKDALDEVSGGLGGRMDGVAGGWVGGGDDEDDGWMRGWG